MLALAAVAAMGVGRKGTVVLKGILSHLIFDPPSQAGLTAVSWISSISGKAQHS